MKIFLTALCLAALATAFGAATAGRDTLLPGSIREAARQINADTLAAPVRFLADDALEGRAPASAGDRLARLYLATELQSLGFRPAGVNGSWEQPLEIVGVTAAMPAQWNFNTAKGTTAWRWNEDYIAASGVVEESVSIGNAELVFVGYGIQAPEYQWDDFKGADLGNKILVMLNNDPDWDPQLFEGNRRLYYGRWTYKYESAARQGAVGAIIVHTRPSAGYPWQVVQTSWSGEQFELPAQNEARLRLRSWATEAAMRQLLRSAGFDLDRLTEAAKQRDFKPVPLGITTSLAFTNRLSQVQTANVAGVLPGSDPRLRDEYVIFTAHHDHLGVGEPDAKGDRIYNGALDNAAGCAQLLAIARAYASLPQRPRRSTMMLFVAAEEQGLLGSRYFAAHPTVPAGRIAANINFDGGNIWGRTRDVTLIGMGKSSLDEVAQSVAHIQRRRLEPDQFPDRGYFYRSDQFEFARIGVPALYFETGTEMIGRAPEWGRQQIEAWEEAQYHQPSDQLDAGWNFDGMIEDAQLGLYAGWLIAQAEDLPAWRKGDEFEAMRLKALAAR